MGVGRIKYARSIGYHYASIRANYAGMDVINNNNQIKAVKQAFDRLDLAGAAA